jgi:hypothetical protein
MVAAAVMIFILGIGAGVGGTVGVAAIARHIHRGPAAVGHPFPKFGPRGQRVGPAPGIRPLRPGVPVLPVKPGTPASPAPAPSPSG